MNQKRMACPSQSSPGGLSCPCLASHFTSKIGTNLLAVVSRMDAYDGIDFACRKGRVQSAKTMSHHAPSRLSQHNPLTHTHTLSIQPFSLFPSLLPSLLSSSYFSLS